ncbi:hypothetical protein V7R83_04185 [Lautropia mirabilis ATCC 51599]|uniref:hypothetical protein n=1 Tax=Lautropia mirabilis TaxID=47671 RepID=UPI0002E9099B|nr:hypothetical protein [Lautropia mirabilis]VEH03428.1 Uncharacterised protein [Lautropia mirabilis]
MTPQTGSHPGNALTPHNILRREVLRHARAAYRHAKESVPADETPEHLKLAQASTPEAQEDDDDDKAALWLPSGTGAGAATEAAAMTEAGAAASTAGAIGTTAATGSALLGPNILGAFAVAAGANLQDNGPLHNISARNRLSTGHDSSREDANAGTEGQSSVAAPSTDTAPLATGTAPTAPSRPTNEGTQAEASRTPAVADAAAAASTEPAAPSAPDTPTADASKPAEGSDGNALPQVKPLPAYSENASVSYAHGENKALGATVFSGSNDETAPAFVRITAIQGKDGEAAAGTMSLLGGNAIVPNQVISRADFDKVVWDASKSEGGSFSFVPVQDAQGTALPGALEQTVTIHEAPALPTYEADMSVAYTYNQSKAVGADIFNGTDSATAPSFVRITAIQGKDGEAAANTMSLKDGDALTAGSVVSRADFDKVVWDASKNEGGSFKFIPVQDAQGTALPGAVEQTVSINEARPLYHIAAENFDLLDAYPHLVNEHPAYVQVTNIVEANDTNGILDALVLGEDGGTVLKVGDIIRAEDFGRVYWNYASNDGGKVFLATYNAEGRLIDPGRYFMELEPSWKTPAEAPALPTYKADVSLDYAFNESKVVGDGIFNGTDSKTAPAFVRITAIQGKDGEAAAHTMSLQGGDALTAGSVVARADFDKVVWDASKNEGGSFKFIPVQDAQGTALPGAVEQTVTIHEAPALPTYQADMSVAYTYNQNKAVGADIFNGTDSATAPAFVRITAIQGKDGDAAANTMSLKDGDALTVGSVVSRADFDKVVWDASKNEGGSFKFIPVQDAQGTVLQGAIEQTVSINEGRPIFHIPAENFDLVERYPHLADEHPAYVKVTNIVETNDTNGILDALVLGEDGGTVLKNGDIIRAEDFGRVYWNHASNDGGSAIVTPYNANDRMIDPGPYPMTLTPKTLAQKSLPAPHHEQEATDASPELVGVAQPAMNGAMPLGAQAQHPGMTPLAMSSTALLDSLLEQHPGTTGLL